MDLHITVMVTESLGLAPGVGVCLRRELQDRLDESHASFALPSSSDRTTRGISRS
jgi:hypothetical protein